MGKNKGMSIALVIIAVIAVTAVGVAFAAYSRALNIEGSATVKVTGWEVRFENLSEAILTGDAEEVTAPEINANDTYISSYDVAFFNPGDSISYTFDVVNNGSFDAEITSFDIPTPTCTGTGDNAEADAEAVCNHLQYTLTYDDEDKTDINITDELLAGSSVNMILTLTYDDDVTLEEIPVDDVLISNLNIVIMYSQK